MEVMGLWLQQTLSRVKLSREHALDTAMVSERGKLRIVMICRLEVHVFAISCSEFSGAQTESQALTPL
jgi:hypothetical protein